MLDGVSGAGIADKADTAGHWVTDHWDFLHDKENGVAALNRGDLLYKFVCKAGCSLAPHDVDMVAAAANVSSFKDEVKENNVPRVNAHDATDMNQYIVFIVKTMYVLPGVDHHHITPELVASKPYQKACQPGNPGFEDPGKESLPNTFRMQKSIIRFIYSMKIQFHVSEITDPAVLKSLRAVDGVAPTRALLLERTKRDVSKTDATAKCKSLLLYYPVKGGTLVTNLTIVLNTSIPSVVAKVISTFSSSGLVEARDTATRTRKHLREKFGDARKGAASRAPTPQEERVAEAP